MANNPTAPTPNNNTKVPRRAWYILGVLSLLPIVLVILFKGVSYVSTAVGTGPFANFGQPDLLRLTPEDHKATQDALLKTPFAERKVLWTLYECDPENETFRPKDGVLPALATYRSKGAREFGEACVDKLVRARQTFTLAVVEAAAEGSTVVLPEAFGYDNTISSPNGAHTAEAILGEDGKIRSLRITAKGEKKVTARVTSHPRNKGADSP